jgi:oxygen-independent coproporphyrinogen-3 oxidase
MAGIYIHIPFCRKACHYCNFHFSTTLRAKNDFTLALLKEVLLQKDYLNNEPINTVYLGGGTPSLLNRNELLSITNSLQSEFGLTAGVEITLEANPDDIEPQNLALWKEAGINRLSIGIQSFFEQDLLWMNRAHNAEQAAACIPLAQDAGFNNLSIDLIYGGPTLSDENWEANVKKAIALNIPHLSCYALTVEPATALDKMIKLQKKQPVDLEKQAHHFLLLMNWLENAGYEHYEISNFSLPGYQSKHNRAYWSGAKYLGLGPAAHSFDGSCRQWNIANNALYIQSVNAGKIPFEVEVLTQVQKLNEYIMTALRTSAGIDMQLVEDNYGKLAAAKLKKSAEKYVQSKSIKPETKTLQLTNEGKLFADGIAADLFFTVL